ncbi:MAG: glycosyltransferase family 39 protein [Cytophagaceae bacterium]|nr:glycosyltransferase family 39 protein [Gemmatimonadaceae bacterium]
MVVLAAVVVRAAFLGQPMRQDEADTVVLFAMTPVRHIVTDTAIPNNHILHSLMVHVSMALFGTSPWAVRLPAFLAGVLLVPLTFLAGRAFYSTLAGLFAATIVAVSVPLVLFSTNARGYTLIASAALGCLLLLDRALSSNAWRTWLAWSALAAFGAFVNPTMLYPVLGMLLWAVLEIRTSHKSRPGRLRRLVIACVVSGVLAVVAYAPAIVVSGWRSIVSNGYVRPVAWSRFIDALRGFASEYAGNVVAGWPLALQVILGLGLVVGVARHRHVARHRWPLVACVLVAAVALVLLTRRPPFPRVLLYLLPMFALTAGAGLAWAIERVAAARAALVGGVAAALVAVGMAAWTIERRSPDRITETGIFTGADSMATSVAGMLRPDDVVAARWLAQGPVDYYLRRRGVVARFAGTNDSVRARAVLLVADDNDDTAVRVLSFRRLRGVDTAGLREIARVPRGSVWIVDADSSGMARRDSTTAPR